MPAPLKAGEAVITLRLAGKVDAQLAKLEQRMARFGEKLSQVGRIGAAAGGALTAAFGAAAKHFATTGDAMAKLRDRTGVGVESLSAWGFAAEQSGADAETLGKALTGMARFSLMAERGLTSSTEVLDLLGISVARFNSTSPEQRFLLLADAIAAVEEPTKRSGLALAVFGRSGSQLLPLLNQGSAGIARLEAEAERLGITLTEDDANAAAALTDALNRLKRQLGAVAQQIGAAVAGPLTAWLTAQQDSIRGAIDWIRANQTTVATVAKLTLAATAAAAAIVVAGQAVTAAAGAIAALRLAITLLTTHPLVALVTLIAAAVVAALHWAGVLDWLYAKIGDFVRVSDSAAGSVDDLQAKLDRLSTPDFLADDVTELKDALDGAGDAAADAADKKADLAAAKDAERIERETAEMDKKRADALSRVAQLNRSGFITPERGDLSNARPQALFDATAAAQVFGRGETQQREQTKLARDQLGALKEIARNTQRSATGGIPVS